MIAGLMSQPRYVSRTPIAFFVPNPARPGQGKWIRLEDEIPEWISEDFLQYLVRSGQVGQFEQVRI